MKKRNTRPVDPGPPPKPPDGGPKSKKIDSTELAIMSIAMFFLLLLSFYNLSHDGFIGLSERMWKGIWVLAENGVCIFMCLLISFLTVGITSKVFRWVFAPYFFIKGIYYLSCYTGLFLFSPGKWETIWSVILVLLFFINLILILITRKDV